MGRLLRTLLLVLGAISSVALASLVAFGVWGAVRVARYEQVEDADALARKADELEWMATQTKSDRAARPNVVVILFDDLGLGDVGAFGGEAVETARIDALADQGMALDQYYSPASICTPSRAGMLTGRWPIRMGLPHVVFPTGHPADTLLRMSGLNVRLPADEITLAEALQSAGYKTAAIGKWHLGDHAPSRPRDLGFDQYFGVLYSNDMSPLALWKNDDIVAPDPVDQTTLTQRYTQQAVSFLYANRDAPFFLYFAHTFPHIPLHASAEQKGQSRAGLYGDVVADLDRSVGDIIDAIDELGIDGETLLIVTSDNGPWFQGSRGRTRGRKGDSFEGGMRVPFIARLPGRIPAGARSDEIAVGIDLLPTVLGLAGVPLPRDRTIDGVDLMPALTGTGPLPERPIYYYDMGQFQAIRLGRFKRHARHGVPYSRVPGLPLAPLFPVGPWLFDLERDPDESYNLGALHPEAARRLAGLAREHENEMERNPRGWKP